MACFLCNPGANLFVRARRATYSVAGLGPICDGYHLVATQAHLPSLADAFQQSPEVADEVTEARLLAQSLEGRSILTEHGRIPVCVDDPMSDEPDEHCYHAHALIFPTKAKITADVGSYFQRRQSFSTLAHALGAALGEEAYFLLSRTPDEFELFGGAYFLPRQFARFIVAHALGREGLADWRQTPDVAWAERNAILLRSMAAAS